MLGEVLRVKFMQQQTFDVKSFIVQCFTTRRLHHGGLILRSKTLDQFYQFRSDSIYYLQWSGDIAKVFMVILNLIWHYSSSIHHVCNCAHRNRLNSFYGVLLFGSDNVHFIMLPFLYDLPFELENKHKNLKNT